MSTDALEAFEAWLVAGGQSAVAAPSLVLTTIVGAPGSPLRRAFMTWMMHHDRALAGRGRPVTRADLAGLDVLTNYTDPTKPAEPGTTVPVTYNEPNDLDVAHDHPIRTRTLPHEEC